MSFLLVGEAHENAFIATFKYSLKTFLRCADAAVIFPFYQDF